MGNQAFGGSVPVPLSHVIRHGNLVFISGQVAMGSNGKIVEGGIKEETRVTLERIKALVEEAGGSLENIVKTTVFLTDISEFREFNEAYGEFFPNTPPARSTFEVKLAIDAKIEIEAIAVLDS